MKAGGQGQRFSLLLNRVFGLRENYLPVDVAPETLPVYDVANPRVEYCVPRGEAKWQTSLSQALDVANFSFVAIVNPAGSERFIQVEQIINDAPAQSLILSVRRNTTLVPTGQLLTLDGRAVRLAGLFALSGIEAAIAQNDGRASLAQNAVYPVEVGLPPGCAMVLEGAVINLAVNLLTIRGYIRNCKPDEMSS